MNNKVKIPITLRWAAVGAYAIMLFPLSVATPGPMTRRAVRALPGAHIGAHIVIYAVLAILLCYALKGRRRTGFQPVHPKAQSSNPSTTAESSASVPPAQAESGASVPLAEVESGASVPLAESRSAAAPPEEDRSASAPLANSNPPHPLENPRNMGVPPMPPCQKPEILGPIADAAGQTPALRGGFACDLSVGAPAVDTPPNPDNFSGLSARPTPENQRRPLPADARADQKKNYPGHPLTLVGLAFILSISYGAVLEFCQLLADRRNASFADIGWNAVGAAAGCAAWLGLGRWFARRSPNSSGMACEGEPPPALGEAQKADGTGVL